MPRSIGPIRESARAKLDGAGFRRTLSKYGYPPDKQQKAIDTVFEAGRAVGGFLFLSG